MIEECYKEDMERIEQYLDLYIDLWKRDVKKTLKNDIKEFEENPKRVLGLIKCIFGPRLTDTEPDLKNIENFSIDKILEYVVANTRYNNAVDYATKNNISIGDFPRSLDELNNIDLRNKLYNKYIEKTDLGAELN